MPLLICHNQVNGEIKDIVRRQLSKSKTSWTNVLHLQPHCWVGRQCSKRGGVTTL